MTTWILVIYLASGAAIEQRTPYADAATCAVAAAHLHAQARLLHTLDPDHTAAVAWVACEPARQRWRRGGEAWRRGKRRHALTVAHARALLASA